MTATRRLMITTASFSTISVSSSRIPELLPFLEALLFAGEPLAFEDADFLVLKELPDFEPEAFFEPEADFVVLLFCATSHLYHPIYRQSPSIFLIALGVL